MTALLEVERVVAGYSPSEEILKSVDLRAEAGEIARHLESLRADGLTFLVIEHHLDVIARLCDPVVVMADGKHLAEGRFADIAADERVQAAYLGRRAVTG